MSAAFPTLMSVPMPILTPRLRIRSPQNGDGVAFHTAINASREHLRRFLPWVDTSHRSLEESENFARLAEAKFMQRTDLVLALFDRTSGQLLGGSGFHAIDWTLPKFEIGYWLHKDAEGRGLMSEAVNALTRYAFEALKAKRVEIRCETENQRSRAVAERLGFTLDGRLRQDRYKIGTQELTDTWIYSRLDTAGLPALEVSW